jgi:hypothetical protein
MRLGGRHEAGVVWACDAGSLARTLPIPQTFFGDNTWRPCGFIGGGIGPNLSTGRLEPDAVRCPSLS